MTRKLEESIVIKGIREEESRLMNPTVDSLKRLIVAVFFLSILPVLAHALTPSQVFDKVKDSVVVVKTLDAQGKMKGFGSGVLISPGRVATNCHVVEGGVSFQVGRGNQLVSATLYAEDGDKDICILDVKGIQWKSAQLGKATDLKVGDPVYAVGAPRGSELSLSDGIVAQLRGGPPPLIQTTAAISPGSSGGGLFDMEGRLVGFTTLYIEGGQSLNFAMPVEWLGDVKPGRKPVAEGRTQTEWLKRGSALEKSKDWQGLIDWYRNWTKSDPTNATAWYFLGTAYYDLKRYDEAIEASRQAIRIDPMNESVWNSLGFANDKLKRYNEAIDAYRQSLRINPESTFIWSSLGIAYDELKRYDEAIGAYQQALLIDPKDTDCWFSTGDAYTSLKRYDEAIEAYRQVLRINPKNVVAWYVLGVAYTRSGNRSAALEVVKELERLDPALADQLFNRTLSR